MGHMGHAGLMTAEKCTFTCQLINELGCNINGRIILKRNLKKWADIWLIWFMMGSCGELL
jgi:hypothetical protein